MEPPTCSTRRAAELAGCTYRQLDYWVRIGLVKPTIEANGSGSRRRFSIGNVRLVWALCQLPDFSTKWAVARALNAQPDAEVIVVGDATAWPVSDNLTVRDLMEATAGPVLGVLSMADAPQLAAA